MKEIQYLSILSWPGGNYWWLYSRTEISIFFLFMVLYDLPFINHLIFCIGFFIFLHHLKVFFQFRSFEFGANSNTTMQLYFLQLMAI